MGEGAKTSEFSETDCRVGGCICVYDTMKVKEDTITGA